MRHSHLPRLSHVDRRLRESAYHPVLLTNHRATFRLYSSMASTSGAPKRKDGGSISPPPTKRKIQSTTTKSSVASFFTPTSKKAPSKTIWQERSPNDDEPATLLVAKYNVSEDKAVQRRKIAAFDLDSTLIQTLSGKKHASEGHDWKWWHPSVPGTLRRLYTEESYRVVVISNQAGIVLKPAPNAPKSHAGRASAFKTKVAAVLESLDLPISVYAATEKDIYRKPRTGMWSELLDDYDLSGPEGVDLESSIFVGDAGGRDGGKGMSKDFSCSDRNFAENVGIKFLTPEEYFLKEPPRPFTRSFQPSTYYKKVIDSSPETLRFTRMNGQDIVLFVGSPGSGKSTFYKRHLQPLDYVRVNQDILKTRQKCIDVAIKSLVEGKSVAVDNTNADSKTRNDWIQLATKHNIPIRCVLFTAPITVCEHNDAVRALNNSMNPEKRSMLPKMAFTGFASRYQKPQLNEGFQDIIELAFQFEGTEVEREIWSRYWI